MGAVVKFNGVRSGILDSQCMILESMHDLSVSRPTHVNYINDESYSIFYRYPFPPPMGGNNKIYYPGGNFIIESSTGKIFGLYDERAPPIIYIYRKIRQSDKNGTGPYLNIYNDRHDLFYTSRKTPLQIEKLNPVEYDKVMDPFNSYIIRQNASKLIVYSGILGTYPFSFYRDLMTPAVFSNGILAVGSIPFAGSNGEPGFLYSDYVITAFAPDL